MTSIDFGYTLNDITKVLRPMAMQLTRDHEETNDLLQETLFKAYRSRHRYHKGTNLKAWVYTIMKNTFLSDYQKKVRRKTYVDTTENQYFLNSMTQRTGFETADTKVNLKDINKAIENLSPQYSRPFLMHYRGFKYNEIANELSLPLGTVKNRIFIARQELKDRLRSFS